MIDLLIAATEAESEPSKTLFFVAGSALTLFAIGVSVVGFRKPDFPSSPAQARAVMLTGVALVLFVIVALLITS